MYTVLLLALYVFFIVSRSNRESTDETTTRHLNKPSSKDIPSLRTYSRRPQQNVTPARAPVLLDEMTEW